MRVSPFGLVVVALTRVVSASWLDSAGLSANNRKVFDLAMGVLDSNFGLPFLSVARLSAKENVGSTS